MTTIEMTQLSAYNESIRHDVPGLVDELRRTLGAKLVAYIAGVTETRAVREWAEGTRKPSPERGADAAPGLPNRAPHRTERRGWHRRTLVPGHEPAARRPVSRAGTP